MDKNRLIIGVALFLLVLAGLVPPYQRFATPVVRDERKTEYLPVGAPEAAGRYWHTIFSPPESGAVSHGERFSYHVDTGMLLAEVLVIVGASGLVLLLERAPRTSGPSPPPS